MFGKKIFLVLVFSSLYMSSTLSLPTMSDVWSALSSKTYAQFEEAFDCPVTINLNPIKIASFIKNNPKKIFTILAAFVAFRLYYDAEIKKRALIINECLEWKYKNQDAQKNAPNNAQDCRRIWLPFTKDPNIEQLVNDFLNGKIGKEEFTAKMLHHHTLADWLRFLFWPPAWFK